MSTPDKRQRYNDLKIALEVFTMLHSQAVATGAPELLPHRATVARDIKATLEQLEANGTAGI
ncbi:MAG: hypothetical protein QM723_02755 [Myxococcaceae bacterium]